MMRTWEKLVSLLALSVIIAGAAYGYERESLSKRDLNPVFQQINREYFAGQLPGVRVEWGHLPDDESEEARKYGDGDYLIQVDRTENKTDADVRRTLEHEACHVQVDWKETEEHGAAFRECARRFPQPPQ